MIKIDLTNWNRRQHYHHFIALKDPYFAVTIPLDVSIAYKKAKENNHSFFAVYLHACMMAINHTENFKYRIIGDEVFELEKPYNGEGSSILKTINRFRGIDWGNDNFAIAYDLSLIHI